MCRGQITPSKIDEICPISNPKPDFLIINAHTKFGENSLIVTCVTYRPEIIKKKSDVSSVDNFVRD